MGMLYTYPIVTFKMISNTFLIIVGTEKAEAAQNDAYNYT